jgi:hypothetical protein
MSDVSAAMNTLLDQEQGETREGELGESPGETVRSGEDRHGPQVLSNKSHATDKSGEASSDKAAPAPRRGMQERVAQLHIQHPDWPPSKFAAELDCGEEYVRSAAKRLGISIPPEQRQYSAREGSLRSRIEALRAEHPNWTLDQAVEHLDAKRSSLTAYAAVLGFKWPRSAPSAQKPAEPVSSPDEPSPAPEPERPPAVKSEPANEAPGDTRAAVSGKRFWLVNDAGLYLNRFGTGFTADRRNAWDGNEKQLAGIRRSYLIARDLREKPVTKELPPAPVNREVA